MVDLTEWGPEIPLNTADRPAWLPRFTSILRIARNDAFGPMNIYAYGLSRGEWAATRAIRLKKGSALYELVEMPPPSTPAPQEADRVISVTITWASGRTQVLEA